MTIRHDRDRIPQYDLLISARCSCERLAGYLAARSDIDHYDNERRREKDETVTMPEAEMLEVKQIFTEYGLTSEQSEPLVKALAAKPDAWITL